MTIGSVLWPGLSYSLGEVSSRDARDLPFFTTYCTIQTMTHDELLTRGVEETVPKELGIEKIASGKKLRVYLGIDPTGAKLHLGHSVPLRKLKAFAEAGHHAIFLIGSFTAMIGDPTGRDAMREPLTKEQVEKNFQDYKAQAEKILDFSKVEIRYNHEWLEKLSPKIFCILRVNLRYSKCCKGTCSRSA